MCGYRSVFTDVLVNSSPIGLRSIAINVTVCLFVCLICLSISLSACVSRKSHVQMSPNFIYLLPVIVAQSSPDGSAICYVLPFLWMTSCFHVIERMGRNQ